MTYSVFCHFTFPCW